MKSKLEMLVLSAMLVVGSYADSFGTGADQFSIDFVDIGHANNAADTTGHGAVDYNYRIGQTEITLAQFAAARAADSRIGDGDEGYWNDGTRTVGTGAPATYVTWLEGAKFANWLTTGDAYTGAYQFNGSGVLMAVDRAAAVAAYDTVYVLPSEDEWYKAAYYKPVNDGSYSLYASGLDTVPTWGTADGWNYYNSGYVNGGPNYTWETGYGAEEQNGTYDMMGNVREWNESALDGTLDSMTERRVIRGGAFGIDNQIIYMRSTGAVNDAVPTYDEGYGLGFRVVAIPEPSSIAMIGLVSGCAVFIRKRFLKGVSPMK